MSYSLTLYERETIINFNEAEAIAGIYTHNIALRNSANRMEQFFQSVAPQVDNKAKNKAKL